MNKKIFIFSSLLLLVGLFAAQIVFAAEANTPTGVAVGIDQEITNPEWLVSFINFMGFGETWSTFIISIAVLVMIFAASYDILDFSAFESDWVKMLLAAGIAVVVAVARGVTLLTAVLMTIAGGSVAIATVVSIIIASFFFIGGSFFRARMKRFKLKNKSVEVAGAYDLAKEAEVAKVREAKAVADAAKGKK